MTVSQMTGWWLALPRLIFYVSSVLLEALHAYRATTDCKAPAARQQMLQNNNSSEALTSSP